MQTEYNQACLNCWGAADNARAELSYCFVPTFFRTTNDRIINVSCASLTPFGVIYGSQVCEWGFIPNSHAWFPYATTSNYARRRCAIGPRRIAVFIGHACCFYRFDSYRANYNIYNTTSMKTAVRLGPIAHLRRAKYIGDISNNQAWERGNKSPLSHTWLPYITPNGVKMAARKIIDEHLWRKKQRHFWRNIASCASPTPKGVIYGHSKKIIYGHLWLIDGHFWRKKTKTFLTKHCVMRQPNPERGCLWTFKKINYEHLWLIDGHFWPKKTKTFMSKKTFYDEKTKHYYITLPVLM